MKKVFLDTNVIIDFYQKRPDFFREASIIFDLAVKKQIIIVVSALSFVNAFYILRKFVSKEELYNCLIGLSKICEIATCNDLAIKSAFENVWPDFEDRVQFESARAHNVEVIVSRNKKDFQQTEIPVQTPTEFLDSYFE